MRKLIIAVAAAAVLTTAGPAFAGPGGTSEDSANNVSCGVAFADVPGTNASIGTEGDQNGGAATVCNDKAPIPIEGRVIAKGSPTGGAWIAADGDKNNPDANNEAARGWARVDVNDKGVTVRCGGKKGGGYNSENPNGGKQEYCG